MAIEYCGPDPNISTIRIWSVAIPWNDKLGMNLAYLCIFRTHWWNNTPISRTISSYNDTQMDMAILIKQFTVQYGPNSQTGWIVIIHHSEMGSSTNPKHHLYIWYDCIILYSIVVMLDNQGLIIQPNSVYHYNHCNVNTRFNTSPVHN